MANQRVIWHRVRTPAVALQQLRAAARRLEDFARYTFERDRVEDNASVRRAATRGGRLRRPCLLSTSRSIPLALFRLHFS